MAESEGPASSTPRRARTNGAPEGANGAETTNPDRELTALHQRVVRLEKSLRERSTQLEDVSRRLRRLERRIDRASASFPVRTALSLRRRLYRLLR